MMPLKLVFALLLAAQVAAGLRLGRSDDMLSVLTGQQTQLATKMDVMSKDQLQTRTELMQKLDAQQASTAQLTAQLSAHNATLGTLARRLTCQLARLSLNTTTIKGKSYHFSYDQPKMSWADAGKFCRAHFMDLVSIETMQEWLDLKPEVGRLQGKLTAPWSSGTDEGHEGKWTWVATGGDVIFYGGKSSPSMTNDKENCLYLQVDQWDDVPCAYKMAFVCETNYDC